VLLYSDHFTKADYKPRQAMHNQHPCSWYREGGAIIPYEFCDEDLPYNLEEVEGRLAILEGMNLGHYGTTVRPIENWL
jgi:hypothetical protein